MSNGTDPLLEAMRNGTVRVPGATRENLVAARTVAFPFKKLGKYDKNITSAIYEGALNADPYMMQEYYRGEMQSGAKKLLNGVVSRGASIVPKVGQGLGHVLGTGAAILSGDAFDNNWSRVWENPLAEAFANMDEGLKESFPVYMSQQYAEGNLLAKMGTATFWATDAADGLAYMASAYVPGGLIGKGITALRGAEAVNKSRMLAGLKAIGLNSSNVTVGASSIYNTISEAGVEAYGINKSIREDLIRAGVPEEEARMRAGEAAASTFGLNLATLWLSNIPQSQWFHGTVGTRHAALKEAIKGGKTKAEDLASKYTWWKSALKGAGSEGLWEENMQTAIERYNTRFAQRETDADWLSGVSTEAWTNIKGFLKTFSPFHDSPAAGSPEDQGATAIFLGALLGSPMSAYGEYQEYKADLKEIEGIEKYWKGALEYGSAGLTHFHEDVKAPYKQFVHKDTVEEDGKTKTVERTTFLNKDNRTEVDKNKMSKILMRHFTNKRYFDESVIAAMENDPIHDTFNKHMGFASYVYSLFTSDAVAEEDIIDVIENSIKSTKGENDELKVNQFVQENIALAKSYLEDLKQIDSEIGGHYDFKNDPAANSFKMNMRKSLLYAKVKSRVAGEIASSATNEATIQAANNIKKDADAFVDGVAKNRTKIWNAYSQLTNRFLEALNSNSKEDFEVFKNQYIANEIAQTSNATIADSPYFLLMEPLAMARDARKSSVTENTVFEEDAAIRGDIYLRNHAIQKAIDDNEDIANTLDSAEKAAELLPNTKTKIAELGKRIEQQKKETEDRQNSINEIMGDIEFGEADFYLRGVLGEDYTQEEVDLHYADLNEEYAKLSDEIVGLDRVLGRINNLVTSNKKFTPSKTPLQIRFLEKVLGDVDQLLDKFKTNSKDFTDLARTLDAIKLVEDLIKLFNGRNDLKKSIKDRALVLLQQRLNKLKKAEKVAAENVQNKSKANLIKEQQKVTSLKAALNYKFSDNRFGNTELVEAMREHIDLDEWDKLNKEYKNSQGESYTNSYAAIMSLIEAIRNAPNKADIIKLLKKDRDSYTEILAAYAKNVLKTTLDNYRRSPNFYIFSVVEIYARSIGLDNIYSRTDLPFYEWKKTNDIYALREALKGKPEYGNLFDITTMHISISSTNTILDILESPIAYKDLFESLDANTGDLSPSLEQIIAATEIVSALMNKQDGEKYDDAVYLRGPAGSGKTTLTANMVLKVFTKLFKVAKNQVIVTGHKQISADNIGKELGMPVTYMEELLTKDLTPFRLIIVDEAAGMTPEQANILLERVNAHNKTVPENSKIRLFLLGDPSQITRQMIPAALQSGHTVDPITTIFRTNVGAVEEIFMTFKDNPNEVTNLTARASHDMFTAKTTDESLFGVMTGANTDLIEVLKARKKGDGRSRVVVVNNEARKAAYQGIEGVEVMTYEEIQGLTRDEVYIDMNKNLNAWTGSPFKDDLEFNTGVYTAMSRARYFVFTNVPGITSIKSDSVTKTYANDTNLLASIKEQYSEYYAANKYFLQTFNGEELVPSKQETEDEPVVANENVEEEVPSNEPTSIPTAQEEKEAEKSPVQDSEEIKEVGELTEYSHYVYYPDNTSISSDFQYTGKGYILKVKASNEMGYNLTVVAEDQTGKYNVIAVLSNKDFTDGAFGEALTHEWAKITNDPNHPLNKDYSVGRPLAGEESKRDVKFGTPVMEIKIDNIQPLDVKLDPELRFRDMGEGFLDRLLTYVYERVFRHSKLGAEPRASSLIPGENGMVDMNKVKPEHVRLEIFSKKTAAQVQGKFKPIPGRVYLVIEDTAPKGSKRLATAPIFVPLANLPFSKESFYYKQIRPFYDAVVAIEQATTLRLGDGLFEAIVRALAKYNFTGIEQETGKFKIATVDKPLTMAQILKKVPGAEQIDPQALESVSEHFETVIMSSYGVRTDKLRMTQEEYEASEYAKDETYRLNRELGHMTGVVEKLTIDSQTGEPTPAQSNQPTRFVLIANNGPAQRAIDQLARENEFVGDTRIRLLTKTSRDKSDMFLLSRTLIRANKEDHDYVYGQFRSAYERLSKKKASGLSGKEIQKRLVDEGYYTQEDIDEAIANTVTPHFTSDTLGLIVNFEGKYHTAPTTGGKEYQGGQRYLREPIKMFDFNNIQGRQLSNPAARAKIEQMVGSKVMAINPLAIKITIASDKKSGKPAGAGIMTEKEFGSPFSLFEEKESPVEQVKEKIKAKKTKTGRIKKSDLNQIAEEAIEDFGAIVNFADAISAETTQSVKIDEEKIELPDSIVNPTPTTANDPVTEEDLIARIKKIDPKVWDEIKDTIAEMSEEDRYQELVDIYQAINVDSLHDDINYAFDASRMENVSKALGKELTEKQAHKTLRRLVPGIDLNSEQVRFVAKELLQTLAKPGEDLWGLWEKGVLYIAYEERNGVKVFYENIIRHEVFHRIYQMHLSSQERANLRKLTDERYGTKELSDYDYQEWLARKYQSWRLGEKIRGFLLKYFKWIARLIDFTLNNRDELSTLFNRIDYGFYTSSTYLDASHASRQAMKFIKKDFGKMDIFKDASNIVKRAFNFYLYIDPSQGGGHNGLVVSEAEAISLMKRDFVDMLANRKAELAKAEAQLAKYGEESAVGRRILNTLPERHIRIGALEILTQTPVGEKSPFRKLVDYLYPNSIYLKEMEEIEDEQTAEDRLTAFEAIMNNDTATGVAAQIEENETKNHEIKLSATMRHWLSSIMKDTKVPVSERYAYFQMLQFFQTINLNLIDSDLQNIERQIAYIRNNNTLGQAADKVLTKLHQTLKEATASTYRLPNGNDRDLPSTQNIVLKHNELTGRTDYYFIEGKDADKYSFYDEIKDNSDISVFYFSGEELLPIYEELVKQGKIEDKGLFNALYKRAVARDVVRAAQNNFHMKEMDILIASQQSSFGRTYLRYIKGQTLGVHTSIKSSIREALISYVRQRKHTKDIGEFSKLIPFLNNSPVEGIQMFLKQIGLAYLAKDFEPSNATTLATTIIETIKAAPENVEEEQRTVKSEDAAEEELILVDPVEEWMDDNESIINEFAESLKFNFEWLRNTSVRSGDKKKLYKFSNTTFMHDLIYELLHSLKFVGSPGNRAFRDIPAYLKTHFFSKNIFVSGLKDSKGNNRAMLYEMNYHDSFRNEFTQSVRTYDRENKAEWLRREFVFGFLGGLATSRSKATSYHQFSYPLADRTRIPVFRTRFMSEETALDAIKEAIKQIRDRNPNLNYFGGYKIDNNTNFELYTKDLHKLSIEKAAEAIMDKLKEAGRRTAATIIEEEIPLPNDIAKAVDKARSIDKTIPKYEKDFRSKVSGKYAVKAEQIERLAELYEINSYLNSYFITQLFGGDMAFYKHSADVVKRMAGPSAPGTSPLVNDLFGMRKKFKIAVVNDKSVPFNSENDGASIVKFLKKFLTEEEFETVKNYYSQKGFDLTDAQGFITPARMNELRRGYGSAYGLGNVLKPVYFSIQTMKIPFGSHPYDTQEAAEAAMEAFKREGLSIGSDPNEPDKFRIFSEEAFPVYLKYSAVVLSDELIEQFPTLKPIRDKMEKYSVDELVFKSGYKTIKPAVVSSAEDVEAIDNDDFSFSNTMELENEYYRLQLNPRHDPNEKVSMFTQLTYFLNVFDVDENTSNDSEARRVYNAFAFLVKKGLKGFNKSAQNMGRLVSRLLDTPGYEQALELIEAGVSLDNPSLEKLLVTQLAAKLTNDTVGRVKFPGGKYTLQSAYGIYKNKLPAGQIPIEADELAYKVNEDGSVYAEMILPYGTLSPEHEAAVKRGDDLFLHGDAFAFRIPSTELHSAVSIKIVGFYDDLKTNVIIGPKELVPLHGSDFDADSLSVIMRSRMSKDFKFGSLSIQKDEFIGYTKKNGKLQIDTEFAQKLAVAMDAAKKIKDKKALDQLERIEDEFVKNLIAETMMEVIRNPRNRMRMFTPISMERFNGVYGGESMKLLLEKAGDPDTQKKYDVSSTDGRYMAFKSIFDGAALTGVFANAIKALAYMIKSGPTDYQKGLQNKIEALKKSYTDAKSQKDLNLAKEISEKIVALSEELKASTLERKKGLPVIKPDFRVTFDGHEYTSLSEMERDLTDPLKFSRISVWETMDALVNSAIDNANEQILFMIGANGITANAMSALVGMGVPLKTVVFLMRQPIIKELSKSKYRGRAERGISDIKQQLQEKIGSAPSISSISTAELEKYIKSSTYDLEWENMTVAEATHYYNVILMFERAWAIGKSIETMASYLNIVREMPVTAEAIGKMREVISNIGDFVINEYDRDNYSDFESGTSTGTLETSDSFAIDIPNFMTNNPHIAIAHQVFERLENLLESTFFVHSKLVKQFIKRVGLTNQIKLAKGDVDSKILNRIEYAREFLKYLMSSIYSGKFEDTPQYYYTNYKGEKEYLEGSKAWFQHFINKIDALQKHVAKIPGQKGNYFLANISISGTGIRSMRYTAGSNLKYEDIILARDAFEELNKYDIVETPHEGANPTYEIVAAETVENFTQFQRDFIVYSILNNGLQYSITSLSQVLSPELFKESDDQLQEIIKLVKASDRIRDNIKDHFKISMVAANAEQLPWIAKQNSEISKLFLPVEKREYVLLKNNEPKDIIDTAGVNEGNYYDIAYENLKYKEPVDAATLSKEELVQLKKEQAEQIKAFPLFIRTSSGTTAAAHIRLNDPLDPIVYYQRIGHAPQGFYDIADPSTFYNLNTYFNLKIPTVRTRITTGSVLTSSKDLSEIQDAPFAIVTYSDVTRQNRRFVTITKLIGQDKKTGQFYYEIKDAFENENEQKEYLNSLLAEGDTTELYTVNIFGEEGYLTTEDNVVVNSPDSIAKFVVGKDIEAATNYILENDGKIDITTKHC